MHFVASALSLELISDSAMNIYSYGMLGVERVRPPYAQADLFPTPTEVC